MNSPAKSGQQYVDPGFYSERPDAGPFPCDIPGLLPEEELGCGVDGGLGDYLRTLPAPRRGAMMQSD
jgi:hypothetical protein